jgi:hypothetical protein
MSAYPDGDSHPTPAGNQKATAEFVPLLNYYYSRWNPGHSATAPIQETEPPAAVEEESEEGAVDEISTEEDAAAPTADEPVVVEGMVQQFLSAEEAWESTVDEQGSAIECYVNVETGCQSDGALQIEYSITPNGWADCGYHFDAAQDWGRGQGLSLWLYADKAGPATFMVFSGQQDSPTPFETILEIPPESVDNWTEVILPWSIFERAHWADADGLAELDPTRMTGMGINFWADNEVNQGVVRVDDIGLAMGDLEPAAPLTEPEEMEAEVELVKPTPELEEVVESVEPTSPPESTNAQEAAESTVPPVPVAEETGGGSCPLSVVAISLGMIGMVVAGKSPRVKRS